MAKINICDKCKKQIKERSFFEFHSSFGWSVVYPRIMLCNKCYKKFKLDFDKILIKNKIIKKEDLSSFGDKNYEEK